FYRLVKCDEAIGLVFIAHPKDFGPGRKHKLPYFQAFASDHFKKGHSGSVPSKTFRFSQNKSLPFIPDLDNLPESLEYRQFYKAMFDVFERVVKDVQEKEVGKSGASTSRLQNKIKEKDNTIKAKDEKLRIQAAELRRLKRKAGEDVSDSEDGEDSNDEENSEDSEDEDETNSNETE
ncbi:hypothetical protein JCM11641_002912, partial [Rhodosporidiobolus odoratus]